MKRVVKKWIEITDIQKNQLIAELSEILDFLINEKKIQAKEIAIRTGIPGSALSHIKNLKAEMITNWKVIIAAVSFHVDVPGFDSDRALGDIKQNKWDNTFFNNSLASNVFHVELAEYKSWYENHSRAVKKQFKEDVANAAMAETRINEEKQQTLFELPNVPAPDRSVLGKSLVDIVSKEDVSGVQGSAVFNFAKHIPEDKEEIKKRHADLKRFLEKEKKDIQSEIRTAEESIVNLNKRLAAVSYLLKHYSME